MSSSSFKNNIYAIILILISGLISVILAYTAKLPDGAELGALMQVFVPPMIIAITIIVYFIFFWLNDKFKIILVIILFLFNIYIGLTMHFNLF